MKKEKSTFSKIIKVVIWAMLIVTVGSIVVSAVVQVMPQN